MQKCSCKDFKKNNEPCIHIYRLFYDVTHPENIDRRISDILSPTLESFDALNVEAKRDFIVNAHYGEKARKVIRTDQIRAEESAGLISISEDVDFSYSFSKVTKDQLLIKLSQAGIGEVKQSWSKVKLIDWISNNYPDFPRALFGDYVNISIAPLAQEWAAGIRDSFQSYKRFPKNRYF